MKGLNKKEKKKEKPHGRGQQCNDCWIEGDVWRWKRVQAEGIGGYMVMGKNKIKRKKGVDSLQIGNFWGMTVKGLKLLSTLGLDGANMTMCVILNMGSA